MNDHNKLEQSIDFQAINPRLTPPLVPSEFPQVSNQTK